MKTRKLRRYAIAIFLVLFGASFYSEERNNKFSSVTSIACEPVGKPLPYFHSKINYTAGVKLWERSCEDLSAEQELYDHNQLLKCSVDNKPFSHCSFKNIKLDRVDPNRYNIVEPGLSDSDQDGLFVHGLEFSVFSSYEKSSLFIRNLLDLERQQLPKRRNITDAKNWPILTKKFGVSVKNSLQNIKCDVEFTNTVILLYAYHTHSVWHLHEGLFRLWRTMKTSGALHKSNVTVIRIDKEKNIWSHREYLDVFKSVKWIHVSEVPVNSCFNDLIVVGYPQHMFDKVQRRNLDVIEYRAFMMAGLGVNEEKDCNSNLPQVTFISRRNRMHVSSWDDRVTPSGNRHIINEDTLVKSIEEKFSFQARAYSFEKMSKLDQVRIVCKSSILIGVHSGALLNTIWLKPGSLLLQTQVPGSEYGSHEIWKRPAILVHQGIGFFDMEQLAKNIGVYYKTVFSSLYRGPSKDIENCKIPLKKDLKFCFNAYKRERLVFTEGTDFTLGVEDVLQKIEIWVKTFKGF